MSTGILVCSDCWREVHQDGIVNDGARGWTHCADGTPRCLGARSAWPGNTPIVGPWCGADGSVADHRWAQRVLSRAAVPAPKLRFTKGSFKPVGR